MVFPRRPVIRVLIALLLAYLAYGPVFLVLTRSTVPAALLVLPLAAGTLGACLWALAGHSARRNAWLLLITVLGGLAMHLVEPFTGVSFCFVAVFAAPFRMRPRLALALTTLVIVGMPLVSHVIGLDMGTAWGLTAGIAYSAVFAFLLSHQAATRRQATEVAEARAREAVLDERARLAREVHDILAHSQSAQIVHLEGVRMLLKQGGDRAIALDRVERAVGLARSSLEETRRALDMLRGDDLPLRERLERLAAEFRAATGKECALSIDEGALAPGAEARLAIARTAQEALTNVRKHAPGASAAVALRLVDQWSELEVRDHGGQPGPPATGGGYGLVGMRERAALIGGRLRTCAQEDGFTVVLRVPR
ncbi:sensor histidine kinase [Nonomuraea insulae]|uniref:histidine kinase n=1 Tax=Nonomuraea insulae TaxID=1616787 RepID=A0ABW1CCR7_9ACTN